MSRRGLDLPRCSGLLLHVSSLPGRAVGDLGEAAFRWVDWLAEAGQTVWQILPLVPVNERGSPYDGLSAFAGNPLLVNPQRLVEEGLLDADEACGEETGGDRVDFARARAWKERLLHRCFRAFRDGAAGHLREGLDGFRADNAYWLEDYALFRALRDAHGGSAWMEWEPAVRSRRPAALRRWRDRLAGSVDDQVFRQFLFHRQWQALHRHAERRGIRIIGDIPIFVAYDSADVWAHQDIFWLDEEGRPTVVSGVPPDYFSATGQRWGNPLYRWDVLAARGFDWWADRFRRTLEQVDLVRVDHFRGFEAYWEIPLAEPTAVHGRWVPGPGDRIFEALESRLGRLPIIAEDLGLITPAVDALRERLGFPGMRVLQFAFDGDPRNPHHPANHPEHTVAYTGTHDNATLVEWWQAASPAERARVRQLTGVREERVHWDLIRLVFDSPARLSIVPVQDILGLGEEARMNTPGTGAGNWSWRLPADALTPAVQRELRELTRATGRTPAEPSEPFSRWDRP